MNYGYDVRNVKKKIWQAMEKKFIVSGKKNIDELHGLSSQEDDVLQEHSDEEVFGLDSSSEEEVWGKKKKDYYNADDTFADEEAAELEEEEAKRMQTERVNKLDEADFGLDNESESDVDFTTEDAAVLESIQQRISELDTCSQDQKIARLCYLLNAQYFVQIPKNQDRQIHPSIEAMLKSLDFIEKIDNRKEPSSILVREPKKSNKHVSFDLPVKQKLVVKEEEEEVQKRKATREILKNRGLTPNRPKATKNPRVKKRLKFEKMQKKIKSLRPEYQPLDGSYGGEKTGISTHVTKSIRL